MTADARYRGQTHWPAAIGLGLSVLIWAAITCVGWPPAIGHLGNQTPLIAAAVLYAGLLVLMFVGIRSD